MKRSLPTFVRAGCSSFSVMLLCVAAACDSSGDSESSRHTTPNVPPATEPPVVVVKPPAPPGDKPPIQADSPVNPVRPAFQAKSSAQLAATIKNCVGPGATTVTSGMILGQPGGFLTLDFAGGQDIVAVQAPLFDGNLESLRTSVRVDQITLEYVTALKNMGNVVGTRCAQSLVTTPSMCACDTFAAAYAMLSRCLGAVADPTTADFAVLAGDFQTACVANRGSAIASLVASSAFAKLP